MALSLKPIEIVEKEIYQLLNKHELWERVFISDIATVQNGFAFKSTNFTKSEGLPLIRIRDIDKLETDNFYNGEYDESFLVYKGDILIGMDGDFNRSRWKGEIGLLNQRVCRIKLTTSLYSEKFFYYVLQPYLNAINTETSSVTVKHLSSRTIGEIPLPLPPIAEQHRIVEKIETLFSELDSGIENLKTARAQLKQYHQSVLKFAFEGKLTEKWRKEHVDQLESAESLLERIKAEREVTYKKKLDEWKEAVKVWEANGKEGKKPTRIAKPKTLPDVTHEEIKNYGVLPESWRWSRFNNVTYKIGDIDHKMPKDFPDGIPYLSTGNLKNDGSIDFNHAKTISEEDYKRLAMKIKPERGDIIFPRYGTIGRNILIDFDKDFLVSYSCAIIKNIPELINSKFAYYYSLSPVVKKEIERYIVQTTQANIGIASIENFLFPVCSTIEQKQIVNEIESRLSEAEAMDKAIDGSLKKAERLRQSILKKAFEGKLVPQDENDEPASELLNRIKIAVKKNSKVEKAGKMKKKKITKKKADPQNIIVDAIKKYFSNKNFTVYELYSVTSTLHHDDFIQNFMPLVKDNVSPALVEMRYNKQNNTYIFKLKRTK